MFCGAFEKSFSKSWNFISRKFLKYFKKFYIYDFSKVKKYVGTYGKSQSDYS
jgi:hypothetical protein